MGQFSSCCCGGDLGSRRIWTSRPFGVLGRPFDQTNYDAGYDIDVLGGPDGTDVVGTQRVIDTYYGTGVGFFAPPLRREIADLMEEYYGPMTWQPTRYLGNKFTYEVTGTVGEDPFSYRYVSLNYTDPNTAYLFTDVIETGSAPSGWSDSAGYLTGYSEALTATHAEQVFTYQNAVETYTWDLSVPVTWPDQVARAKAHLDFNVGSMTTYQLRHTMTLPGGQAWAYDAPGGGVLSTSEIKVIPQNGSVETVDEELVYTEWTIGSDQTFATSSGIAIGTGIMVTYGTSAGFPEGYSGDPIPHGEITSPGPVVTDDVEAAVTYGCYAIDSEESCTANNLTGTYTEILASGDDYVWGDILTCWSPESYFTPGWYLLTEEGIALKYPADADALFPVPVTGYFALAASSIACDTCPP